ncbi:MAG: 30S ribosomal protein S4 [Armatimonadetes bacterium CG2_30_59_28]|nr:30S ribosomal protein S4 [Armatimonadota bacterium]OIO92510.1 MAG: 30S ribosomal protein S4 [Armatimonadetes bacterium CG2_30_59_28]PIU65743.1 MAG: 30S ribosomal protein S4 [Armatimonadetes bacterium CG07_land_8_20_14_0_80_59_28]PIX38246.1 MAG: 30S ribosomal protein S4 [Armatimonadetes bacterium CG_4_8_14_3_um_filter_58_9]PIY45114.1 MAG: 30S ribosomal protein S4 [Armatimonadetes bacterium CG_4_10_14_3_um_filter_59_10]
MAKYRGPVCRLCRREGVKLFLKGEKCLGPKCEIEKRTGPPGSHGDARPKKMSDYGVRLREKQKARRMYGILEKQFKAYFAHAARMTGISGDNLLQLLERRLDNVVFRLGYASSRREARMLVTHRHFAVNGRPVNVPSLLVKPGDMVSVKPNSRAKTGINMNVGSSSQHAVPAWLLRTDDGFDGRVLSMPARDQIDSQLEEQLIVEYYSR